jgi:wyosine [tRNA(Phe)-imidazoG37] synthetase (radical SAM superfamily)
MLREVSPPPGVIYGPMLSRRLGKSLGINILPPSKKVCSFDCIYCQFGPAEQEYRFPSLEELKDALREGFRDLKKAEVDFDYITLSGGGEPTLHPQFPEIVEELLLLRGRFFPDAKLAILSNSSTLIKPEIAEAIERIEQRIMKLDVGSEELFRIINRPRSRIYLSQIVEALAVLKDPIIQAIFFEGPYTNTSNRELKSWAGLIKRISPSYVQIYTLARLPAFQDLKVLKREKLCQIEEMLRYGYGIKGVVY